MRDPPVWYALLQIFHVVRQVSGFGGVGGGSEEAHDAFSRIWKRESVRQIQSNHQAGSPGRAATATATTPP